MGTRTTGLDKQDDDSRNRRIILLNGPPNSGKDTLGEILSQRGYGSLHSFKERLITISLFISGVSITDWVQRYNNRELKETPWERLGGLSQREYLIRVSEEWLKPTFGEDYFGRAAAARIKEEGPFRQDIIFTDSGFPAEMEPLRAVSNDIVLVRLHREGCTFAGDSRGYMYKVGDRQIDIDVIEGLPHLTANRILIALNSPD